jgi:phage tail-like protein
VGFGEDLWLWHEEFLAGKGTRRNGLIVLANELRVPIKMWSFQRGIPARWTGPGLSAGSSALAIESIEIAHERLELVMSPGKAMDAALGAVF